MLFFVNHSSPATQINCFENPNNWLDVNFSGPNGIQENVKKVLQVILF